MFKVQECPFLFLHLLTGVALFFGWFLREPISLLENVFSSPRGLKRMDVCFFCAYAVSCLFESLHISHPLTEALGGHAFCRTSKLTKLGIIFSCCSCSCYSCCYFCCHFCRYSCRCCCCCCCSFFLVASCFFRLGV